MTLDDLRVFAAVCEVGNLSTVARQLSRTQSAVSQHVKRLERETGLALIERRPRGVRPTPAGHILYQAAVTGLATVSAGLDRLSELRAGVTGAVKITTGGVTVRHFMAEAITEFRRRHPDVALEFHSAQSTRRCIELLRAGDVELAWITLTESLAGIEQRPVLDLPWLLVVNTDDELAGRDAIYASDLANIRYLAHPHNSASRRRLEREFLRLDCHPEPVGVADWDTAILLAELGVGHAVLPALPRLALAADSPVKTIPIPQLAPLSVGWATRHWNALSPLAAEYANLVASHAPVRHERSVNLDLS